MITVLEIEPYGETILVRKRRMYLGSVVYAMLKINGFQTCYSNGREYFRA